jgi:hypothetical protein
MRMGNFANWIWLMGGPVQFAVFMASAMTSAVSLSLSEALLLFNEEVKTPHHKGEYRNPN